MLTSLFKIEEFLVCDVCKSTLRQTRTLSDCGHRFCLQCVLPYIEEKEACPTCQLPTQLDDLQIDRMHDNLVNYVAQLKHAYLSHSLTPLEDSLRKRQDDTYSQPKDDKDDFVAPLKRPNNINTQESEENYEDEYNDMPDRKKYKPNDGSEEEEDHMAVLDDILSFTKRPSRTTKGKEVKYTVDSLEDFDDEMEDVVKEPRALQRVGSPRTPEETATSNQTWKCKCDYENASFMQVCGICKTPKNENTPPLNQTTTKSKKDKQKGKAKASDIPSATIGESSRLRRTQATMADRSLEDATVPIREVPVRRTRRMSSSPMTPLPSTKKSVHIIYTTVTPVDEKNIEKSVAKVKESNIHFLVVPDVKDIKDVTHVITSVDKKGQCHRTLKYLHGILLGKWVVSPKWLTDSVKAKKWLPEQAYEVKGDAKSGLTHAPEKGRERLQNKESFLLSNLEFYFAGDYSGVYNKKDLTSLVTAGGATVLTKKPSVAGSSHRKSRLNLQKPIVIYSQGSKKRKETWLDDYQVRDPAWLVECIGKLAVE